LTTSANGLLDIVGGGNPTWSQSKILIQQTFWPMQSSSVCIKRMEKQAVFIL